MKKYLSVAALDVRTSIYKIFRILMMMILAQLADFYWSMYKITREWTENGWNVVPTNEGGETDILLTFDWILADSHIEVIFALALAAVMGVLLWTVEGRCKGKSRQLLWRLNTTKRENFVIFGIYHTLCFGMLVVAEVIAVALMFALYQDTIAAGRAPQSLFMAFYRNSFLHTLWPMSDWFRGLKLICFIMTWGLTTAFYGYLGLNAYSRAKGLLLLYLSVMMGVLVVCGLELFWLEFLMVCLSLLACCLMTASVWGVFGEVNDEELATEN